MKKIKLMLIAGTVLASTVAAFAFKNGSPCDDPTLTRHFTESGQVIPYTFTCIGAPPKICYWVQFENKWYGCYTGDPVENSRK